MSALELVKREFFAAVVAGDVVRVVGMIKEGMNPDATDKDGSTGLLLAAGKCHQGVCQALIDSGCNLNAAQPKTRETALALARRKDAAAILHGEYNGHWLALVDLLERAGAGTDASRFASIHTAAGDGAGRAGAETAARPATAAGKGKGPGSVGGAARPGTASGGRPASASKRPGTAIGRFTTGDVLKAASGLFSVFDRNKAQEEVKRLEADVRGVDKVQEKLAKAEAKAAVATQKAEHAHRELMARAEAFAPKVQRVVGAIADLRSFDAAKAVLAEARSLERESGLSAEALANLGWPDHELGAIGGILEVEASLAGLLRSRRHVDVDDRDGSKVKKTVKLAIKSLAGLVDEDGETRTEARGLGLPLDGPDGLLPKCFAAAAELVQMMLERAVEKEAALSNAQRGKKAVKKDVLLAYDTLDSALDLAEEAAEALQLDVATPVYEDAQRKLQLLEQQHAAILF